MTVKKSAYLTSIHVLGTIQNATDVAPLSYPSSPVKESAPQPSTSTKFSFFKKNTETTTTTNAATKKAKKTREESIQELKETDASLQNPMNPLHLSTSTGLSSFNTKYPNAREVSESTSTKLYALKYCFLSLLTNILLILLIHSMQTGLVIGVSKDISTTFGCVVIEVLLLFSNIVTFKALDSGFTAYFGRKSVFNPH